MCRKGKFNLSYKVLSAIAASSVLLLLPFNSFAQDLPCEDQNPFEVLVLAFIIFGVIKIKRRENTRIKPSV
jgi:hypothetical protein